MSITDQRPQPPAPPRTLGDLIYKARKLAGLNVQELALKSRVSRNSISAYEADVRLPRPYMLEAIAKATEQEWLLDYSHLCAGASEADDEEETPRSKNRCYGQTVPLASSAA